MGKRTFRYILCAQIFRQWRRHPVKRTHSCATFIAMLRESTLRYSWELHGKLYFSFCIWNYIGVNVSGETCNKVLFKSRMDNISSMWHKIFNEKNKRARKGKRNLRNVLLLNVRHEKRMEGASIGIVGPQMDGVRVVDELTHTSLSSSSTDRGLFC